MGKKIITSEQLEGLLKQAYGEGFVDARHSNAEVTQQAEWNRSYTKGVLLSHAQRLFCCEADTPDT